MTIDLEEFRTWVAGQSGGYAYLGGCPITKFLEQKTERKVLVGVTYWKFLDERGDFELPEWADAAIYSTPHTFPALLERLT